jgi:hypothetical protein
MLAESGQRSGRQRRTRNQRLGKPPTDTRDHGYAQRLAALQDGRFFRHNEFVLIARKPA